MALPFHVDQPVFLSGLEAAMVLKLPASCLGSCLGSPFSLRTSESLKLTALRDSSSAPASELILSSQMALLCSLDRSPMGRKTPKVLALSFRDAVFMRLESEESPDAVVSVESLRLDRQESKLARASRQELEPLDP
jgi:hypothetical protein